MEVWVDRTGQHFVELNGFKVSIPFLKEQLAFFKGNEDGNKRNIEAINEILNVYEKTIEEQERDEHLPWELEIVLKKGIFKNANERTKCD
jgi:hypothetical protein